MSKKQPKGTNDAAFFIVWAYLMVVAITLAPALPIFLRWLFSEPQP